MFPVLQKVGIGINHVDAGGNGALHYAVVAGDVRAASTLLVAGAEPNLVNKKGETPLFLAASHQQVGLGQLLLAWAADPNIAANQNVSPLQRALSLQDDEMAKSLLKGGANPQGQGTGAHPLMQAAKEGRTDLIDHLLAAGADPHKAGGHAFAPHLAALNHFHPRTFWHLCQAGDNSVNIESWR